MNFQMENILYDELHFYAFSANNNAGKYKKDIVNDPCKYDELNKINNWRQMFSSFWTNDPFVYEGNTYLSYEHAYQASKFKINGFDEFAYKFTLESEDEISRLKGKAVQKAGRNIILNAEQIKNWDANVGQIKQKIYAAKFTLRTAK